MLGLKWENVNKTMFSQMITPGDDGLGENQKHKREVSVFLNSSFKKYKLKKSYLYKTKNIC